MAGVPFDCFERGSAIGGNWLFDNPNAQSACYEKLEINTSGARMAYSDFPMPSHFPRWPAPEYPGHFDGQQMHAHDYLSGD